MIPIALAVLLRSVVPPDANIIGYAGMDSFVGWCCIYVALYVGERGYEVQVDSYGSKGRNSMLGTGHTAAIMG